MKLLQEVSEIEVFIGIKGAVAKYYGSIIYRCDVPIIYPVYYRNLLFCNCLFLSQTLNILSCFLGFAVG